MADTELDLANAPMGGTLVSGGATFRIWAPRANAVYVSGDFNEWKQDGSSSLRQIGGGHWAGFLPNAKDGDQYLFYVNGVGTSGYKRDPRARTLTFQPAFPFANCVLRHPDRFPWHEGSSVTSPGQTACCRTPARRRMQALTFFAVATISSGR